MSNKECQHNFCIRRGNPVSFLARQAVQTWSFPARAGQVVLRKPPGLKAWER